MQQLFLLFNTKAIDRKNLGTGFPILIFHPLFDGGYFGEVRDDIKMFTDLQKYNNHYWIICVDMNMVNISLANRKDSQNFPAIFTFGQPSLRETLDAE
ncbi:hypothetical protein AVEN_121266-1 [Araneus ventricosus]|uniref:Uncharacterized protein n=1 Tax=Araneus ventricosus TaxID=182803 RepID=A0A4Y2CY71_ARAVE|nr:hypothetical protein AVEN_121266-1 [Araneus ventricosus]